MRQLFPGRTCLLSILFLFLLACNSPQATIVGKWSDKNDGMETMEFFSDKTFTMNDGAKKAVFGGKWNALDDGRIKGEMMAFGMPLPMMFVLTGDELEVEMGGDKRRLVRTK